MEKKLLGKGRFGKVYKVNKDDETIALKEITIEAKNKEKALILGIDSTEELEEKTSEVMKEISFLNDLKGDSHIVNYIDYYVDKTEDQYTLSIEMELLKQLDSIHDGIFDSKDIKKLLDDMLDALQVLEEHHIVHGDIKPSNIMVDEYGNYKLTDFGISKILGQKFVGYTKAYAPQEVLEEGRYTSSSDLYSLGLVIYQMFNKNLLPFMKDKDDLDSIHNRFEQELPRPEGMDKDFYGFLKTALNNNPEERYFSAKAMKSSLDYLYKENHIPAITISVTELILIVSKLTMTPVKGMEVKVISEAIKTTAKAATGSAIKKGIVGKIASLPVIAKAGISAALVISGIGGGYVVEKKINPSYDDLILNAKEAILDKDYSKAQKYLDKAKDKDNKRYEYYETLTKMYVRQGKGQKALDTLSTAQTTLSKEDYKKIEQYEKTSYYSIYKDIINQLEKEYGKANQKNIEENYSIMNGLSFLELFDYNNDGINELTAISIKDQSGSIKIYTYNKEKNKVELIFDKSNFVSFSTESDFTKFLSFTFINNIKYISIPPLFNDSSLPAGAYTMSNSKFVLTKSFTDLNSFIDFTFDNQNSRSISFLQYFSKENGETQADFKSIKSEIQYVKDELNTSTQVNFHPSIDCDYSPYISLIKSNVKINTTIGKNFKEDKYYLYDIDDDGIKELVIIGSADYLSFYKISKNTTKYLGGVYVSAPKVYINKTNDKLFFIENDYDSQYERYCKQKKYLLIKDDKINTTPIEYIDYIESKNIKELQQYSLTELEKLCK